MRCVAIAAGLCLAPPWAGDLPEVKAKGVLRVKYFGEQALAVLARK